jgi:DNA-binding NarL/FixJ family response regulator
MKAISIYIADDHTLMLDAMGTLVESIPELRLLGKFNSGKTLLEGLSSAEIKPDVILMDIEMPEMDGVETTKHIRKIDSNVKIIALTMHQESHFISKMIAAGANGYLIKNVDRQVFLNSITKVLAAKSFIIEGAHHKGDSEIQTILSQREIEILKEIVKGKSNKEIGDQFFISDRTVDTHRTNIKRKLKISTLSQLIEYAKNNGIQ